MTGKEVRAGSAALWRGSIYGDIASAGRLSPFISTGWNQPMESTYGINLWNQPMESTYESLEVPVV